MADTISEQLTKHLTDVHSIEEQALQQLLVAPRMAGDPQLARAFREHIEETRAQERRVRALLETREADPSRVKDLIARAGGIGMALFARSQPDTPGKLVSHAYSYEHMRLVAERAGDSDTARVAERIIGEERAAAAGIRAQFEPAMDAALRAQGVAG